MKDTAISTDHRPRRAFVRDLLLGSGGAALKAMATGLPVSFLSRPLAAQADEAETVDAGKAQYVVFSTSDGGEAINTNGPGSYEYPDMVHAADPAMEGTPLRLGDRMTRAAQLWTTLPQWALDRALFLNHGTFANNHGMIGKVLRLMGRTKKLEMIPAIYAKHLAPALKTVQIEPIATGAGEILMADGVRVPNTPPTAWKELLGQPSMSGLALERLREQSLDEVYALLKARGTKAQRRYLDSLAKSNAQARSLAGDVGDLLTNIKSDGDDGQVAAAIAIIKMNLTPLVAIGLHFSQDNHVDPGLMKMEVPQHKTGIAALSKLLIGLKSAGLEERVTFVNFGVFGRNFRAKALQGREHWGNHHTTLIIGRNVRAGIAGGIEATREDYQATSIDSVSGQGVPNDGGDVKFGDTLAAAGKTIGVAVGIKAMTMNQEVSGGKVIAGALV